MTANERVLEFLHENGPFSAFYVATVDGDKPKVRPFTFVMIHDGKLCFATNNQKPNYAQLQANPNVEICTMGKHFDWLRLQGKAVFCSTPEFKAAALEAMPSMKAHYSPDDDLFEIFYLEDAVADFCTMKGTKTNTESVKL
jgi:uncharacterized pyridoxamine 5'-phosphate oxidase family protein